ncbi:MAG: hypothetical protein V4620_01140 [Bacteroidota bacterium]
MISKKFNGHSFHIPVMGIGFTIDSPIKVAAYGISSTISLVDDILMEKMRAFYTEQFNMPFESIDNSVEDSRAKRITAYLNMVNSIVKQKFEQLKQSVAEKGGEFEKYMNMLPDYAEIKKQFNHFMEHNKTIDELKNWANTYLQIGSIDVNIMTKLDKENLFKHEKLPAIYNDAHAALRGFANSNLHSSIVLSAGLNPKLYSYFEQLDTFFPDKNGDLKKKVILKISDYRSALIQGKFLAKKGIWVSEYRVESGLNCGGHAFGNDASLMGPILEEFKQKKQELIHTIHEIYIAALADKKRFVPSQSLPVKFTAQGGVGTAEEHRFLINKYELDSIGWGTPFLLVPEATSVDNESLDLLCKAKEKDLYLSNISPLGVPFNSVKGNTKEQERLVWIDKDRPGSSCPREFAKLNTDFTEDVICTASRQYQNLKLKSLQKQNLPTEELDAAMDLAMQKTCLCVGLGTSALLVNGLSTRTEGTGVAICPGPNMAYYSKIVSLQTMCNHIYGKENLVDNPNRPHMFLKELELNIDYYHNLMKSYLAKPSDIVKKQLSYMVTNLNHGIVYYRELFSKQQAIINQLNVYKITTLAD